MFINNFLRISICSSLIFTLSISAQEVEEVIPQVVLTADDEMQTKSVDYGNIVGLLIEAIKEQQEEIEALKNKINLIEE